MSDLGELFEQASAEESGEVSDNEVEAAFEEADQADNPEPEVEASGEESADVDEGIETDVDNPVDGADETVSFDWQEYSDQLVPITVAGEEQMVPLKDLRDGFMRQSDYTRKTQEIAGATEKAQWADSVQAAFEADPAGTLKAFAEAYGLLEQEQAANALNDLDEDVRPFAERTVKAEQQLAQIQQQMQHIEMERIKNDVRAEVQGLRNSYGESFDAEATLREAAARNITLEDAHLLLMGRQYMTSQQQQAAAGSAADKAAAQAAEAAEQKRQKAKATATSASTQSFKASDIPADDFSDIGELMEQIMASGSN